MMLKRARSCVILRDLIDMPADVAVTDDKVTLRSTVQPIPSLFSPQDSSINRQPAVVDGRALRLLHNWRPPMLGQFRRVETSRRLERHTKISWSCGRICI